MKSFEGGKNCLNGLPVNEVAGQLNRFQEG